MPAPSQRLLSSAEALTHAIKLHQQGRLDVAEALYRSILEDEPENPDVMHFLGVLSHQRGRSEEAVVLVRKAIAKVPGFDGFHINLGNILGETGKLEEAEATYERVLKMSPGRADVLSNLGVIQSAMGDQAKAEDFYRRAIAAQPDYAYSYSNLGILCSSQGRIAEAVEYHCQAIVKHPEDSRNRRLLGMAYYGLGKIDEAAAVFRDWVEQEPDDPTARHMYAACTGVDVPERAADDYIEQVFDHFASSFDEQLQVHLSYKAPQLISEAFARYAEAPAKQMAILDAGCGTGLCGPLVREWAASLVGVDLSGAMLAKAEGKGCYDQLHKAELTAFLESANDSYDVIISADTLVYFGALDRVGAAAFRALKAGGYFVFSVEDAADNAGEAGFRINPHGRYAHSQAYVRRILEAMGFSVRSIEAEVLRREGGKPVNGLVTVASKARVA